MSEAGNNKSVVKRKAYEATTKKDGKNYLLVIGIDDYAHCPTLYNAVKDATDIVEVLQTRFRFDTQNITTLYNEKATKRNIYNAFRAFRRKVTVNDNFLVYFSGHGEFDKDFGLGYWIPVNAELGAVDEYIPNSEIRKIFSAIESHHTFLMVDSCFSGALFAKGANRNISLRKERDPSRWGLTAGRNEIVTDGEPGKNSPFAESILYQLKTTTQPIGVAELCDKVLEVVSANASQTPRGEPLKVDGHKGGQFVFHLKMDEAADWTNALAENTVAAFQVFIAKYPDSDNTTIAKEKIKGLQATSLWKKIELANFGTLGEVKTKLRLVNQYVDKYEVQIHYDEALNIGELLEYKKQFLQAKSSEFALRRFLRRPTPNVAGANAIKKTAQAKIANWKDTTPEEMEEPIKITPPKKKKIAAQPTIQPTPPPKQVIPSTPKPSFFEKYGKYLLLLLILIIGFGIFQVANNGGNDITQVNEPRERKAHDKVWLSAKSANTIAAYEAYQKRYPKGKYYSDATSQIRKLKANVSNANSGTFKDARDGQSYKWVRLKDGKKWMAQNLNHKTADSWWYDNKSSNGDKYGRLYTWQAAQKACPGGWRLPTADEWWKMTSYYGKAYSSSKNNTEENAGKAAYKALMQGGSSGFSALLGGTRSSFGDFYSLSLNGNYWSNSEQSFSYAWSYYFYSDRKYLRRNYNGKSLGFSCRCLQD